MQKLHTLVLVLFSGINMECYFRLILSTQIRLLINQQCSKFFDIKKKLFPTVYIFYLLKFSGLKASDSA